MLWFNAEKRRRRHSKARKKPFREFPVGARGMAAWLEVSSPELSEERPLGQVERNRVLPLQGKGVDGHPVRPSFVRRR